MELTKPGMLSRDELHQENQNFPGGVLLCNSEVSVFTRPPKDVRSQRMRLLGESPTMSVKDKSDESSLLSV